jgi:hypothetical protein
MKALQHTGTALASGSGLAVLAPIEASYSLMAMLIIAAMLRSRGPRVFDAPAHL